jgi:hypothetical protein
VALAQARYYSSDALATTLASSLGTTGNPSVVSISGLPSSYPYTMLIDWGLSTQEAISVTSAPTGTGPWTLPCTRGIDNSTGGSGGVAHSSGAVIVHGVTAQDFSQPVAYTSGVSGFPWQFNPSAYGALADGKVISDAAITSTTATLTSATAGFTAADVGKHILVNGAAGTNVTLSTTISAFTNSTTVTLAANATATVSAGYALYGTDDTTAINTAVTAATTFALANNYYAEIVFGPYIYVVAGATQKTSANKGNAQIPLPLVGMAGNPTLVLGFIGTRNNAAGGMFAASGNNPAPETCGTVLASTLVSQANDGTWGLPSVIGGPTPEQGYTGGFTALWDNVMPMIDGMTVLFSLNPTMSAYDFRSCVKMEMPWGAALAFAANPVLATVEPSNSFAGGLFLPQGGNNAHTVIGTYTCFGSYTGVVMNEHGTWENITCIGCFCGMFVQTHNDGHGYAGTRYDCEANQFHIQVGGSNVTISLNILLMDAEASSQYGAGGFHIQDASNELKGTVHINDAGGIGQLTISGAANLEIISANSLRGIATPPSVPATTVAFTNPFWRHADVYLTSGGAAVTAIAVNGTATGLTLGTTGTVLVRVPSGATITLTYASTAPTWVWNLE